MRKLLGAVILSLMASAIFAQSTTVKGTVNDTLSRKTLTNAVVTLLQKKDSSLYQFQRTDKSGSFQFNDLTPGKYVLLITYPKFADFADEIEVKTGAENDLGAIPLTLKSQLLDAVVIKSAGAIRIKGDTTEFVADSFHVKDGATVEDLLKRLPGFQVNSKGEITAQGQRVNKVLVDGEEFFGDDPTAATKNIGAKAVDKVQLFDNKTEQQNITGISSGTEGKTVNIKLKEDKKKGTFGKAEAGTNFDNIVDARLLFNQFIGKKKFSVYGTKSNTSTGSLNWEDRRKLGIENDFEYDELSGYYYSFGSSDEFSDWSLRGLPNSYSAGGLFIDKWNNDKHGVNSSYRYNRLLTTNVSRKFEQNITKNDIYFVNTNSQTRGLNEQHAANFKYEWKLDSLTSLKFTTAGTYKETSSFSNVQSATNTQNTDKSNTNVSTKDYDAVHKQLDNQLQYKQLFKKKNRQLLATLRYGAITDDQTGMFYSNINYFTGSHVDSTSLQDQLKDNNGTSATYGGKITYLEPLGNKWSLAAEYSYNKNNSTSHRNTFDKSSNGKYENLNPIFSNNFDLDATSNSGMLIAKYVYKKLRFAAGSGLSSIRLNLNDLDRNKKNEYNFTNITPQASINYNLKPQSGLGINYRGTTRQPTIDQLQPIRNNEDPLNEFIGNPDLQVGFNHNVSIYYNSYKVLSARGIWANSGINFTRNSITQRITISPTGKRTYQPVNVNGNYNWYSWNQWNKGEGDKKFNHSVSLEANGGRNVSLVNDPSNPGSFNFNRNNYYTVSINYGVRYEVTDKYRFYLSPKIGYNSTTSSLNPDFKNTYYSYGGNAEGFVMLPGKLELNTEVNFDLQERINGFTGNPNIILWNANIARKVFKDKSGKIIFLANDLLNKNKGFTRTIDSERVYEESYQRISQYFLLKFEWTFSKMPGQK
ncbi:MAG TPA: TonB-dependent receptor [Flavisolibacter sp.]|nr:TonB-dependent receptor [Flavisolibacter sp.]